MTIGCLIIDDEAQSRRSLAGVIDQHAPELEILGFADSAVAARRQIDNLKPDLLFLDVEMPGPDGFSVLEDIEDTDFDVIFVTAHEKYALRAFRCAAMDYLLKPVAAAAIKEATQRVIKRAAIPRNTSGRLRILGDELYGGSPNLAVPTLEGYEFVKIADILRCKAESNYTRLYLRGGRELLAPRTLGDYEILLRERNFARVHISYLVNLQHVQKYRKGRGGVIVMSDGTEIEVAHRRKESFLERFAR